MMMNKFLRLFFFFTLVILCTLTGCKKNHAKDEDANLETLIIKKQSIDTPLFYNGTIQPLQIINVLSPVDGYVEKVNFTQGEIVEKDQTLVLIRSSKLIEDFQSALTDYLSKRDDYATKSQKLKSDEELHKLGFISDDDHDASVVAEKESYVTLLLSKFKLEKIMKSAQMTSKLEDIDFGNRQTVIDLLEKKRDVVTLIAPTTGIAIAPAKSGDSGDGGDDSGKIAVGSEVKQDAPVIGIGDLNGVTVNINVNEVEINQLKEGQKVTVSGPAFENYTLNGTVDTIQTQAKTSDQGLPTFPVTIKVKTLTKEQQKTIHIGMTAQVSITLIRPDVIMVPLEAVMDNNGTPAVNVKDPKTGTIQQVTVTAGVTTEDSVEIKDGLKPGDILVYHH